MQHALCEVQRHVRPGEGRVGAHADQSAFELSDVGLDATRDERENFRRGGEFLSLGLLLKDGQPRLEIGWLDVGEEPPFETRPKPFFERRDLLGRPVRCDDQLALRVKGVEGVEELLLGSLLALEELDVVDEKDVGCALTLVEGRDRSSLKSKDEFVHELLG